MTILYQPSGKARVYAPLAVNIYTTCASRCSYCFCPSVLHVEPGKFYSENPLPRHGLLKWLEADCRKWAATSPKDDRPPVHLCFVGDPFTAGADTSVTENVICLLHRYGFPVQILTKGIIPATAMALLNKRDKVGVTLTTMSEMEAAQWEPGAAKPEQRIENLLHARDLGIPLWLSLEPVMNLTGAVSVMLRVSRLFGNEIDPLWVGPLNHRKRDYDWDDVKMKLVEAAHALDLTVRWKDEAEKHVR